MADDPAGAALIAARLVASTVEEALLERPRASLALSGGSTPTPLFGGLIEQPDLAWDRLDIFQVDERLAPLFHEDRNRVAMERAMGPMLAMAAFYAMDIETVDVDYGDPLDFWDLARSYGDVVSEHAGRPPRLDLVHLGLGADGHTASLFTGDVTLGMDGPVAALTMTYAGRRRITLTASTLQRARRQLWFITGENKAPMVARLLERDQSIAAGQVITERSDVVIDRAAAAQLDDRWTRSASPSS